MSEIKVSVCVLSYNHEKYLRDCLDGIVMQRTTFPIEAWVHDDASSDSSQDIIKEYQKRYPDIIKPILQTENQYSKLHGGIFQNFVYPHCRGEYFALCEGDDYWIDPFKLQKQVDFMESHPDYVAYVHNAIVQYETASCLFANVSPQGYDIDLRQMLSRWSIPTASLLYKASEKPNFDKSYPNGDYALEIWLLSKGKMYYNPQPMSVYRKHGGSVSVAMNQNQIKMYSDVIALLEDAKLWFAKTEWRLFDESIANYEHMSKDSETELYYANHLFMRALRPKTYKRLIRSWLGKILNR